MRNIIDKCQVIQLPFLRATKRGVQRHYNEVPKFDLSHILEKERDAQNPRMRAGRVINFTYLYVKGIITSFTNTTLDLSFKAI